MLNGNVARTPPLQSDLSSSPLLRCLVAVGSWAGSWAPVSLWVVDPENENKNSVNHKGLLGG